MSDIWDLLEREVRDLQAPEAWEPVQRRVRQRHHRRRVGGALVALVVAAVGLAGAWLAFGGLRSEAPTPATGSSEGARIAYDCVGADPRLGVGGTAVCVMGLDGLDRRVLLEAPTGYRIVHPAWAPDGSRIAYWIVPADPSCVGCHRELLIAQADGADTQRVASGAMEFGHDDAWSPDGEWIAFVDSNGAIAKIHPDGTGLETLTQPRHPQYVAVSPAWSPDGERIAFAQWNDVGLDLWIVNADGSDVHLVPTAGDIGDRVAQPAWSPDGRLIAFAVGHGDGGSTLWAYDAARGLDGDPKNRPFHLAGDGAEWNVTPVWIDGGARVAFLHREDGRDLDGAASLRAVRIDDRTVETLVEDFPPTTGITVQPPPGGGAGACLERGPAQFIACSEALQKAGLEDSGPQGSSIDVRLVQGVIDAHGSVDSGDARTAWAVTFHDVAALSGGATPSPVRIDWEMDIDARTGEFVSEGQARAGG